MPNLGPYHRGPTHNPYGLVHRPESLPMLAEDVPVEEGLDVEHFWTTLKRNWRIVLGVAAACFLLVMGATMVSSMEFASTGRLYLGELEREHQAAGSEMVELSTREGDLGSEIEIIMSRSLVSRAILASGLNVALLPSGSSPPEYYEWLLSDRDPDLLDVAAKEVRAVNTSLPSEARQGRWYEVRFVDSTTYELWSDGQRAARGKLDTPLEVDGMSLTLVAGSERSPKPGSRYDMSVSPIDGVADGVLNNLEVTAPNSSGGSDSVKVVNLSFTERSPRLAASFLDELMHAYLHERQSWKTEDATAAEEFVTKRLQSMRATLDDIQEKLAKYRSNTDGVVLDSEAQAMIAQMGRYEEQRVAARLEVAALADFKRSLKKPNPPVEAFMLGEGNDTVLGGLASSLAKAQQDLAQLQSRFNPASPDVQQQKAQVDAHLRAIDNYVTNRLSRSQESLGTLSGIISQYEQKLKRVPEAELGLAKLQRESEVYSALYSNLLTRQQQVAIVKASTVSKNRILDEPKVSFFEESPRLRMRMLSAPFGLALGVFVVLFRGLISGRFQSEVEVRRKIGNVPIFASVPKRHAGTGKELVRKPQSVFDVLAGDLSMEFVEAYRTLRTNLYHACGPGGSGKIILITSPNPGDGKTTCALSLASTLAADGKRVLVIDADLRRQTHRVLLDQTIGEGLRDLRAVLIGQCEWRDVARPVSVSAGQFYSIASSGTAPAELLSSERMMAFLSDARASCDYVILDVPSFPMVADALVLAATADCVLTVLRVQQTPKRLALDHMKRLSRSTHSYAVVLNDAASLGSKYEWGAGSHVPAQRSMRRRAWLVSGVSALALVAAAILTGHLVAKSQELNPEKVRETTAARAKALEPSLPPRIVPAAAPADEAESTSKAESKDESADETAKTPQPKEPKAEVRKAPPRAAAPVQKPSPPRAAARAPTPPPSPAAEPAEPVEPVATAASQTPTPPPVAGGIERAPSSGSGTIKMTTTPDKAQAENSVELNDFVAPAQ